MRCKITLNPIVLDSDDLVYPVSFVFVFVVIVVFVFRDLPILL